MFEKFLVFDVDNTITESRQEISSEMAKILNHIPLEIAFISGTLLPELKRMISSKLIRKHHLLPNTGTHYVIIEKDNEKEILKETLSSRQKEEIVMALKKLKEAYNLIPLTSEEDQIQDRGSQITFSVLGRWAPMEKKYSYDPDRKKREEFVKYLRKMIGENRYEMNIGGTTSIDITQKGKDKGKAMVMFMQKNNLKKKDILFFGDKLNPGGNDFPVIKTGIRYIEVKNPKETIKILKKLYKKEK